MVKRGVTSSDDVEYACHQWSSARKAVTYSFRKVISTASLLSDS